LAAALAALLSGFLTDLISGFALSHLKTAEKNHAMVQILAQRWCPYIDQRYGIITIQIMLWVFSGRKQFNRLSHIDLDVKRPPGLIKGWMTRQIIFG